ncbi:torsin-1A-like isoform X2 [Babylonia areolata]|uniref:torsin-1A-like isoform X2 n=1 Tax=Babylonia areolata TaxID=304850 RepID=UPI003FD4BA50
MRELSYFFLVGCIPTLSCFGQTFWDNVGNVLAQNPTTGIIYCQFYECCTGDWIKRDTEELERELEKRLYGQHLVKRAVRSHIKGHVRSISLPPSKPLVLSLHGPTGTGKNHVSRLIAEGLYKEGMKSENVHLISVPAKFPHQHRLTEYKDYLQFLIEEHVKKCPRSLFIFDEIDKMPRGLIDIIKPYLDHHTQLNGVDYRQAIFMFLSNSGANEITKYIQEQLTKGRQREEIQLKEVEATLSKAALNSGGLWHSELIGSHLVTAYIPFLPLQRTHIRHCIRDALLRSQGRSPRDATNSDVR